MSDTLVDTADRDAGRRAEALGAAQRGRAGGRAQLASQLISLVGLSVLLRLLAPGDYGLVGMILPLVMFLRIFATLGLNVATVQRPEIRPEETSSLFWLNVLLGCATAGVAAVVAPYLGVLYAKPQAATQLRDLTWALAGTRIVAALVRSIRRSWSGKMRLGPLGAIRITAQLLAVVCGGGRRARRLGCVGAGGAAVRRTDTR